MYYPPNEDTVGPLVGLADLWRCPNAVSFAPNGALVDHSECRTIIHSFVGCNLVIDLVEEVERIHGCAIHSRNAEEVPGLDYDTLGHFLFCPERPTEELPAAVRTGLLDVSGLLAEEPRDPWRRIHLLLFREVLIRDLWPIPTGIAGIAALLQSASNLLIDHVPSGVRPPGPGHTIPHPFELPLALVQGCRRRTLTASQRFATWWKNTVKRLSDLLTRPKRWLSWTSSTLNATLHTPTVEPCVVCDLCRLGQEKSRQWAQDCLHPMDNRIAFPDVVWFGQRASDLLINGRVSGTVWQPDWVAEYQRLQAWATAQCGLLPPAPLPPPHGDWVIDTAVAGNLLVYFNAVIPRADLHTQAMLEYSEDVFFRRWSTDFFRQWARDAHDLRW